MYESALVARAKDSITKPTVECGALPKIGVNTPNLRKWLAHTPAHRHNVIAGHQYQKIDYVSEVLFPIHWLDLLSVWSEQ